MVFRSCSRSCIRTYRPPSTTRSWSSRVCARCGTSPTASQRCCSLTNKSAPSTASRSSPTTCPFCRAPGPAPRPYSASCATCAPISSTRLTCAPALSSRSSCRCCSRRSPSARLVPTTASACSPTPAWWSRSRT